MKILLENLKIKLSVKNSHFSLEMTKQEVKNSKKGQAIKLLSSLNRTHQVSQIETSQVIIK